MPTTINFKNGLDYNRGRPVGNMTAIYGSSTLSASQVAYDMRGRNYQYPYAVFVATNTRLIAYNMHSDMFTAYDGQTLLTSVGVFQAGSYGYILHFVPSQGPSGTLTTGNSTTKINIGTALPATVTANALANRGDGLGFIIRIIGNSTGGSGKIEERRIAGNTSGTTPSLLLDEPLSFTPQSGDRYELLSGRIMMCGSQSTASGNFRFYDVATRSVSSALSVVNQPNLSTNPTQVISLDEAYVPYNRNPGEGFLVGAATYDAGSANWVKSCLTATATAAGTITGQASAGDASVLANEYRNFQIRIVEDTGTPTAVGQRRRITSHTAGASAVYTLASNWTVTPSSTAKFVIENDNDKMLVFNSVSTSVFNYNHAANTWDTTTWAARSVVNFYGPCHQSYSIIPDEHKNSRHSYIFSFRGAGTTTYDMFDIAGGANGVWTNGLSYFSGTLHSNVQIASNTTYGTQIPWTQEGRYFYFQNNGFSTGEFGSIYRFDMKAMQLETYTNTCIPIGTSPETSRYNMNFSTYFYDGTYVSSAMHWRPANTVTMCQYPVLS